MRFLIALAFLLPTACGDDDKPTDTTPETTAEVTPETVAEVTPETVAEVTPETVAEVTPEVVEETTEPTKVDAACSEGGYTDCFINADCEASQRCENMSANEVEIPCCVTGARGTKVAGEPCTSENECDTSLCISYNEGPQLCSRPCDDTPCPAAASECVFGLCVPPSP
jgi:hypothetical protein